MKNTIILLFAIILCSSTYAQVGFIEVEVKDTLKITPISMDYAITVNASYFMNYSDEGPIFNVEDIKPKVDEKMQDLALFLTSKKYAFEEMTNKDYGIHTDPFAYKAGYVIHIKNNSQLVKLTTDLQELSYAQGHVTNVLYGDETPYEEKLLKTLIDKANKKAKLLASISGMTLGKIIEIKEVKEIDVASYSLLDAFSKIKSNFSTGLEETEKTLQKGLVVKFRAE